MATSVRKSSKKPALNQDFSLLLRDVQIVKLKSERIIKPEDAPKGTFTVEAGKFAMSFQRAEGGASEGPAEFSYNISIVGYKIEEGVAVDDKPKASNKSFSVKMEVAGIFQLSGAGVCAPEAFINCLSVPLGQMHCVVIEKLRNAIADLGYRNVRPSLGSLANAALEEDFVEQMRDKLLTAE